MSRTAKRLPSVGPTLFGDLVRPRIVDLFCGAGGTSEGVMQATGVSPVAVVDHSPEAIASHAMNHPESLHFQVDVFNVIPEVALRGLPLDILIGGPSCTHFSRAKGGLPLDLGIRSQAEVFVVWARAVRPAVILVENVEEFLTWGPLLPDLRPDPAQRGAHFRAWVQALQAEGYRVEWRVLCAADFGAPTSRRRLFVHARRDGKPIRWPEPTHGRAGLPPHRSAAECIDWTIPCPSIFTRKKPLAPATCRRLAAGIVRFVLNNPRPFIVPVGYGERAGQSPRTQDVDMPLSSPVPTLTTGSQQALVTSFLERHYTGAACIPISGPFSTITTIDHHALVLVKAAPAAVDGVSGDVDAGAARCAAFLTSYYSGSSAGRTPGNDAQGAKCDSPCPTITTKGRFGLVTLPIQSSGRRWIVTDIGLRMLNPHELKLAQGFPANYRIEGTQASQIRAIGNSVPPPLAAAIVRAALAAA